MGQAVLESLPDRRRYCNVIRIVHAPVRAGKDLLRNVRIHYDRVHGNIGQVTGFIRPGKRSAISRARDLEHVARCRRGIRVKAAHGSITDGQRWRRGRRIKGDAENWTIGKHGIVISYIDPVPLRLSACPKVKTDPGVPVVRANHGDALILWRVLHLIDKRATSQSLFRHVLVGWIVCDVPVRRTKGGVAAVDCFPDTRGAGYEMPATAGNTRRSAIIAPRDSAME